MTALQVLQKARELIAEPSRWCQGCTARDSNGRATQALDYRAHAFCMAGAIYRAQGHHCWDGAYESLGGVVGDGYVGKFNDAPGTTHEMVLAAFDEAIRREES